MLALVSGSNAPLYSSRWSMRVTTPSASSAGLKYGLSSRTPFRPTSPEGCSQISSNARRQVVVRIALADLAEGLREGDGELAMLAERQDGVADFLGAGHLQFAGAEAGDQALHPLVTPGRIQSLHEIADRQPMAERRPRQRSARPTLGNSVGEIQGQHGTFGHRMLRLGKKPQRNRGTQR